ncbi:16S rRNA (adenine(1518)-N(6)/adenine(1519)-N(6))-dimethyltransferase RsmA [Epidermidibacterium keratini]|uniref:Ribosomal RNA small subunit methyltransferase A n=1 Tax=Epidermidibacterium keratini TaxID=1891644 RepID=A0A7L4YQA8_9ACTN|nr:16S rRNA (adenine(1518)-N(6)/adenine(1519)-N(6))-dimethyltransferase RsmA [Epidermidibacterium keratini]QHC01258.1 16S rRNA (adenine(1518)-N(6)/adenine(1519)-N(6))-dimethyltransferase RsmA [Epidermidibacterium keratini]
MALLGPARIRELADEVGLRPTKTLGQNFVHDANTVRRIIAAAQLEPDDVVLEVGPGLGSLTLGLLEAGHRVTAVEIDPALAARLPQTVAELAPHAADRLQVVSGDAMRISELPDPQPTAMVANLPYNVSVPVLLHLLATFPSLHRILVMVQAEVAHRLAAAPGSKLYGVPSVKAAWYADVRLSLTVSRQIFWPVPNVDSALVSLTRRPAPRSDVPVQSVFAVVDAAFAQRRKMLRAALGPLFGSSQAATTALEAAGVDPTARGETLDVEDFVSIAQQWDGSGTA